MAIVYFYPEGEGKTLGMYLNMTNECTSNCIFCLRNFRSNIGRYNLNLNEEPCFEEIWNEVGREKEKRNFDEIVFCGLGEPLKRLNNIVLPLSSKIKKYYPEIPIRVDTNGQAGLLYPEKENIPRELFKAG